jgi:plasmid maintenance system antidote protein VapI
MIGALERDERELSVANAKRLAAALGVTEQWLLGLDATPEPPLADPGLLLSYRTPASLLELQRDLALRRAMGITRKEIEELCAMRLSDPPDKEGWVALLNTLRAVRPRRGVVTVTKT